MLVHRRVTPSIKFAGTHLYTWVERGTVRVKCLAQEHNIMSPARARTRTARSGDERTNHEATAPPTGFRMLFNCGIDISIGSGLVFGPPRFPFSSAFPDIRERTCPTSHFAHNAFQCIQPANSWDSQLKKWCYVELNYLFLLFERHAFERHAFVNHFYTSYLQSVSQQNQSSSEDPRSQYDQPSRKKLAFSDWFHARRSELHHSSALHGLGSVDLPSSPQPVWVSGLHWPSQLMWLLHLCHLQMRVWLSRGETWW